MLPILHSTWILPLDSKNNISLPIDYIFNRHLNAIMMSSCFVLLLIDCKL